MIEIQNVRKSFGDREILKGIDMTVPTGSVTVILGPSGSGKTTFLRTLNFLEKADAGQMTLNDITVDLHKASKKEILKGGQQQRVGIARAIAMDPAVILFDEPTSALEPELVGEVLGAIKNIAREMHVTMIVVTHEIAFAKEVADQVIFMEQGVIVEQGTAKEVISNPREDWTRQFLNRYLGQWEDYVI